MKEIFDRRYPVTSFFLLVTALVLLPMLVTTGGNFDRADTPISIWSHVWACHFASFLSRFGVSSLPFCSYWVGAFHC